MPKNEFSHIVDDLPIPAYLFDGGARRFVAANKQYCEFVGYTQEELLALPWPKIMADDYVQPALSALSAEESPDQPTAWAFKKKDGRVVIAHILYRPVHLVNQAGRTFDVFFAAIVGYPGQTILPAKQIFGK